MIKLVIIIWSLACIGLLCTMNSFTCSLCSQRKFCTTPAYLLHVRSRHADDANCRVKCGIHGCQCEYNKYYSLCKHICRHHSDMLERGTLEGIPCSEQDDECLRDFLHDNIVVHLSSTSVHTGVYMCIHNLYAVI